MRKNHNCFVLPKPCFCTAKKLGLYASFRWLVTLGRLVRTHDSHLCAFSCVRLNMVVITYKKPYGKREHVESDCIFMLNDSPDSLFPLSSQQKSFDRKNQGVRNSIGKPVVIWQRLGTSSVKERVDCALEATPRTAKPCQQLEGAFWNPHIIGRVEHIQNAQPYDRSR